jgi:hypothetical protein
MQTTRVEVIVENGSVGLKLCSRCFNFGAITLSGKIGDVMPPPTEFGDQCE